MNKEDFNKNLRVFMLKYGVGFSKLQKSTKIPKSTLSESLNGKLDWTLERMQKVSEVIGVSLAEIIGGSLQRTGEPGDITHLYKKGKIQLVPMLGFADCGKPATTWYDAGNKFFDAGDVSGLTTPFILNARGDSMRPYIVPGDKLLCADIEFSKIKDRTAVICLYKGIPDSAEANAKLILKRKDHVILYSVNTMYPPEEVYEEEIIKIYKLVRIIREVK